MKGGVCMRYKHLALVYRYSGLSGLIRQGADCYQIWDILSKAREQRGINSAEEQIARESYENSTVSGHGRIMYLAHEKFQAALDNCLFTLMSNLVITPTKAYFRGGEEELCKLKLRFNCIHEFDDIYQIEGNLEEIKKAFVEITK